MPEHVGQVPHAPTAAAKLADYHRDVVGQVEQAIAAHDVVVVGMAWNPHVPKARKILDQAGIAHHDLDFGNYTNMWRQRLAVKLWAGWPTLPMVFVKGHLIGGATDTKKALEDGSLRALLDGETEAAESEEGAA